MDSAVIQRLKERRERIPERVERLHKAGLQNLSRTDPANRILRERAGVTLVYTATQGVSEDHLIVAQQVAQDTTHNDLLLPMVDLEERQCGEKPQRARADSGLFSLDDLRPLEERKIDAHFRNSNMARWLNRGCRLQQCSSDQVHRHIRGKLWSPVGRAIYDRRKAVVEPVGGVLKEQRGMRGGSANAVCRRWR